MLDALQQQEKELQKIYKRKTKGVKLKIEKVGSEKTFLHIIYYHSWFCSRTNNYCGRNLLRLVNNSKSLLAPTEISSNLELQTLMDFEFLSGPNQSSSSSVQMINGQFSQSKTVSYNYYATALNEGSLEIVTLLLK